MVKKSCSPLHVSDGRVHVGTTLSLAGLAILLSGSLVYAATTSAPVKSPTNDPSFVNELNGLRAQLNKITEDVGAIKQQCNIQPLPNPTRTVTPPTVVSTIPPNCIATCKDIANGSITSYQECVEKFCKEQPPAAPNAPAANGSAPPTTVNPNQPNFDMSSCLNGCEETTRTCSINAGKNATALQACTTTYNACTATCKTRQQATRR